MIATIDQNNIKKLCRRRTQATTIKSIVETIEFSLPRRTTIWVHLTTLYSRVHSISHVIII